MTRRFAPWRRAVTRAAVVAVALASWGCGGGKEPAARAGQTPQERAQQLIEAGNSAYSAGNYGLAARRYAAAAVVKQDDPAAYYGMGMALSKLGRDEEARKAYTKARELVQNAPVHPSPSPP